MFRLILLLLISSSSYASYEEWKTKINGSLAGFLYGRCDDIQPQCKTDDQTPLGQLSAQMSQVPHSEDAFFQSAASDQVSFLQCDKDQMDELMKSDFQVGVLRDLGHKLPRLRQHYKTMSELTSKISGLNTELESMARTTAKFAFPAQLEPRRKKIATELERLNQKLRPEADQFNSLMASIWRSEDPHMNEFIMRAVGSEKSPEDLFRESQQSQTDKGLLGIKAYIGTDGFSFKEQVLDRIKQTADADLKKLLQQKDGRKFNLDMSTKQYLITGTEWADHLGQNSEAAQFMCKLDQRYVSGDAARKGVLEVSTFFIGGAGAAAKLFNASKYVRLLSPAKVQGLMRASKVTSLYTSIATTATLVDELRSTCLSDRPEHFQKRCDPANLKHSASYQKTKLEAENCALNLIFAATGYLPALANSRMGRSLAAEIIKDYPLVMQKLSATRKTIMSVPIKRKPQVEKEILDLVSDPQLKKGFATALDDLHDPKALSEMMVKLQEDTFALMRSVNVPSAHKNLTDGVLDPNAMKRVLNDRAEARGVRVLTIKSSTSSEAFHDYIGQGYIIDEAPTIRADHGVFTHRIQQELIYDSVVRGSGKSYDAVVKFFGTKEGLKVWEKMFDSEDMITTTSPAFFKKEIMSSTTPLY